MIHAQSEKNVAVVVPVSIGAATATSLVVDTLGYKYVKYVLTTGAGVVTATEFSVTECATSGGSYTAVTGSASIVLPGAEDNGLNYGIMMQIVGARLQYQKVVLIAASTAGLYTVNAVLSNADEVPITAAARGLAGQILIA